MIELRIPVVAPSSNLLYSGSMDRWKRTKMANQFHALVCHEVKRQRIAKLKAYPVDIEVVSRFGKGKRLLDCDNTAINAKLVIDGLVCAGVLADDSPKYVRSVRLVSERSDSGEQYTLLRIVENSV